MGKPDANGMPFICGGCSPFGPQFQTTYLTPSFGNYEGPKSHLLFHEVNIRKIILTGVLKCGINPDKFFMSRKKIQAVSKFPLGLFQAESSPIAPPSQPWSPSQPGVSTRVKTLYNRWINHGRRSEPATPARPRFRQFEHPPDASRGLHRPGPRRRLSVARQYRRRDAPVVPRLLHVGDHRPRPARRS